MPFCNTTENYNGTVEIDLITLWKTIHQAMIEYKLPDVKVIDIPHIDEKLSRGRTPLDKLYWETNCHQLSDIDVAEILKANILITGRFYMNVINGEDVLNIHYEFLDEKQNYLRKSTEYPHLQANNQLTKTINLQTTILDRAFYLNLGYRIGLSLYQLLDNNPNIPGKELLENQTNSDKINVFNIAKRIYRSGAFQDALTLFWVVKNSNTDFNISEKELNFYFGACYFGLATKEKANNYLLAKSYFQMAGDYEDARDFIKFCDLKVKPALWYDTPAKREDWWRNLNEDWQTAFREKVLAHLSSYNAKKDRYRIPNDMSLRAIFNSKSLFLNKSKLKDLAGLSALTKLQELHLDENDITYIKDIDHLPNLKLISVKKNPIQAVELNNILRKDEFILLVDLKSLSAKVKDQLYTQRIRYEDG